MQEKCSLISYIEQILASSCTQKGSMTLGQMVISGEMINY